MYYAYFPFTRIFPSLSMKKKLPALIFIFFSLINSTFAGESIYKNYSIKDGLPSQTVYCAIQDNQGFMWFGTDAGVCRFDGKNFKIFTTNNGLPDNEILRMNKDSKGRIWFLSLKGMLSYFYNDTIYNGSNDQRLANLRTDDGLMSFLEDYQHNLWFGTLGSQVICITEKEGFKYDVALSRDTSKNAVGWIHLYEPSPGKIWIPSATSQVELKNNYLTGAGSKWAEVFGKTGFFSLENTGKHEAVAVSATGIYDLIGEKIELKIPVDSIPLHLEDSIISAAINQSKDVWISTSNRQTLYFRRNGNNYDPPRFFLPGVFVGRGYTDTEGNIWICTIGSGVYKVSPQDQYIRVFAHYDSESWPQVMSVAIDTDKNIWCGLSNGTLTCIKDGNEINYKLLKNDKSINRVLYILPDSAGNIFCASDVGLFFVKKISKGKYARPVESERRTLLPASYKYLSFDRKGKLYASSHGGISGFTKKDDNIIIDPVNPLLPAKRCYAMYFDFENRLWFENFEQLFSFDGIKLMPFQDSGKEFGVKISHISGTNDSTIVISTLGNGILFLKDNKITGRLTENEGLVSNLCRRIFIYGNTIYVATIKGFSVFNYENGKVSNIENFSSRDGIISDDIYSIVCDNDYIYLATSAGLCQVNKNLKRNVTIAPPVYFTSIYSGSSRVIPKNGKFSLNYDQQDLLVNYIAITYERPEQVVYQYRLNGNSKWEETPNANLQFSSLLPGHYSFELRARKFNSGWSNSTMLSFIVNPPFWKMTWFRILLSFLIGFAVFFLIREVVRRRYRIHFQELRQREALITERNRIAADVHDDIGAELSNLLLLARISGSSATMDNLDKARVKRIEHAAKSMISKVDEIIWALNPVNDKLANVIYFIERYAKDFLDTRGIRHTVTVPEYVSELIIHEIDRRNIFLIVKELLNNIQKHSDATEVKLSFQMDNNKTLKIEIADNGKGFISEPENTNGRGIKNIRIRIEQLSGRMSISGDQGVSVTLMIPLK
jgi:signal transduction histidine kinase/ligand-binding sensor domain-containing protein